MSAITSCGPNGNGFRIDGSFRDMQAGELYIYNLSDDNPRFDTITIKGGDFIYKGEAQQLTPYMLVFPNGIEQVIFVDGGQELEYEATANDLKNYTVTGNEENKLMNQFRKETYTQSAAETASTARRYITDNATSPVALYLFNTYFLNNPDMSHNETSAVLDILKSKQPDNNYIKEIDRRLEVSTRCQVGKTLKDVTLTQSNKKNKKLWATESEYNLIAFWSTWMPGGYDMSWRIHQIYNEYKNTKQLRVVAVSLDIELHRWESTTYADSLTAIEHYCDGLGFESPVAKEYGITTLPLFILTDNKHKIISSEKTYDKIKSAIEKTINKN